MSTDLPPEAYTRETLQAAFDWLQTQPDVVRASIHTPESLVSLFQKARRLDDNDHPVSSKKFVSDLKTLASSLDQFSGTAESFEVPAAPVAPTPVQAPIKAKTMPPLPKIPVETPVVAQSPPRKLQSEEINTIGGLDSKTQERVKEVQSRFNLSDENEAIRLLISLGYEKFSKFE